MKKITFAALAVPLMWVLLLLLLISNYKGYAQERMVLSGIVKSADGTPLEGVTVWQKDSNNGTQTNEQGFYTLSITPNATITFEYLGFKTQQLKASTNVLNVTMQTDDDTLEELVINAGYYTVKDKERTGSISKITSKEIGQQPVANPLAAMQGRMAGVNITQSSGTPGGGFDIQIRGRNSLRTEGNAPLYIVDGVPYAPQSASDILISVGTFYNGNISPLNSINPSDIESIEVLKDADATAIYGSRGSNGVVLITTKKGSSDKTTFSVQSTTSVSSVAKFMDLMNTEQYLKMRQDAYANDAITTYPVNAYDVNGTWDQNRNTNWQKEFIGGKAISQSHQFSISGGSGRTNYLLSTNHRKDGTVFPGDFGYKRTNFLLNVNHQSSNDRFSIQANVQKSTQNNNTAATDLTKQIFLAPNAPALYDDQRHLNWENNTFENPMAKLNSKYKSETNDLLSQFGLNYKLTTDVSIHVSAGTSSSLLDEFKTIPFTIYNPSLGLTSANSSITQSTAKRESWIVEPKISWNKQFKVNKLEMLFGSTFEERKSETLSIVAANFTSNELMMNLANAAYHDILSSTETKYKYAALFGRINYAINDTYFINITGRRDGSSRFGRNNRFANFGAIGGAWLFSRETFFENNAWLSFGKLRASYGIAGSDLIGDYQYLNTYGIATANYDGVVGIQALRLYNPDFSWETNKKLETALELEFLKGRLATSIAYYRNRSSNQLVGIPLPATTGFSSVQANLNATVENTGWEFTLLSAIIDNKELQWTTSINFSAPRNKLIAFPNLEASTYENQYEIGKPITIKKMYHLLGVNETTGLFEFTDFNNDGIIDLHDKQQIVNVGVKSYGAIQNRLSYKNWSIDFLWQFVKQNAYTPDYSTSILGMNTNKSIRAIDYYTANNTTQPNYQSPSTFSNPNANQAWQRYVSSDGVVMDASFIRLKSFQLQYGFDVKTLKINAASIYLQGYNLLTITKFWGHDPETVTGFLPALRTIAVGFDVKF